MKIIGGLKGGTIAEAFLEVPAKEEGIAEGSALCIIMLFAKDDIAVVGKGMEVLVKASQPGNVAKITKIKTAIKDSNTVHC